MKIIVRHFRLCYTKSRFEGDCSVISSLGLMGSVFLIQPYIMIISVFHKSTSANKRHTNVLHQCVDNFITVRIHCTSL